MQRLNNPLHDRSFRFGYANAYLERVLRYPLVVDLPLAGLIALSRRRSPHIPRLLPPSPLILTRDMLLAPRPRMHLVI